MTCRTAGAPDRVEQFAREERRQGGDGPPRERDSEARARALLELIEMGRRRKAVAAWAVAARAAGDDDADGLLDKLGLTADLGLSGRVPALRAAVAAVVAGVAR